ncbi:MAG TPA: hypothetical protein PKE69_19600, partial [Pyrinomonadaceae bacterium]|nr:hypothetical protein [Pyrinomonadaceae bacterium]
MKLSKNAHRKIEQFFAEHLSDDSFGLPEIVFYGGTFTKIFTRLFRIEGITFGKRIFIFPENFWRSETDNLRINSSLAVHEIVHVLQYRREGFFGFLFIYLRDYWRNLRGFKRFDAF